MSAQELRAAAALMRSRAEVASDGPWTNRRGPGEHVIDAWDVPIATVDTRENRRHIASWHPTVALAVADLLDATAEHVESHECEAHCEPHGCDQIKAALVVALAYVNEAPDA